MMRTALPLPIEEIRDRCREFEVAELSVFGSVLGESFRPDSDVDFLVKFKDGVSLGPWMTRYFELEEALSRLVGRPVDLVMQSALEQPGANSTRREHILKSAETIFVAR